jgi:hypothetical protein
MRARHTLSRENTLRHPLRPRRATLDMQPHVVDSSDVCEESDPGTPQAEARTTRRDPRAGWCHPCGLPHDHPLRPHQPRHTEAGDGALHRPRTATHQDLQLVDVGAVRTPRQVS